MFLTWLLDEMVLNNWCALLKNTAHVSQFLMRKSIVYRCASLREDPYC